MLNMLLEISLVKSGLCCFKKTPSLSSDVFDFINGYSDAVLVNTSFTWYILFRYLPGGSCFSSVRFFSSASKKTNAKSVILEACGHCINGHVSIRRYYYKGYI